METERSKVDTANEPVDVTDEDEFMDTGVLHERRKTGNDKPAHGKPGPRSAEDE